jgi:hypothetical protein
MFHVPFNRSALAYPTVRKNVTAAHDRLDNHRRLFDHSSTDQVVGTTMYVLEDPQAQLVAALDFAFLDDLLERCGFNSPAQHAFAGMVGYPHIFTESLAEKVCQYNLLLKE